MGEREVKRKPEIDVPSRNENRILDKKEKKKIIW